MKIFISYASQDKDLVGELKRCLEDLCAVDVFVAHDDISVSAEWMDVILSNIDSCSVFIPFITPSFFESEWTDQETGYALAKGAKIIPINAGGLPYGFIKKWQALQLKDVPGACIVIIESLIEDSRLTERTLEALISAFGKSNSYASAGNKLEFLLKYENKLSRRHKNEIVSYSSINAQIYQGWKSRGLIEGFIRKNREELDEKIVSRVLKKR
jgi:hypothetical protein